MTAIGYVGLGAMGGALAQHLTRTHKLVVMDRNEAAVATMVAKGAIRAANSTELAREADVIVLCLPRTSDVREVLFAPGGLAEALAPGKLVIDQTSGVPEQTAAIAAELAQKGVAMLDAPVSGGIPAAQAGRVTIIASGPDAGWVVAEPVLRAISGKVFRCSKRVGDAQALKLVNNAIGTSFRMATLELVALGRKAGLGLAPIVKKLNTGPAANFTTANMLPALVEGRSTTNFALALMVKDLNGALALGAATGSALPLTTGSRGMMQAGLELLGKDAKLDEVIGLTGRLAGVELRGEGEAEPGLLAEIELATIVGNVIAVSECVAMGRRFGLPPAEMARILNAGSAWCAVSDDILPALARSEMPRLDWSLGQAAVTLTRLSALAAELCTPFLIPGIALNLVQEAIRHHGRNSTLGNLTFGFERA